MAGTNGKGSTATYIASILQTAGFKTGIYTSPHLVKFNERICINGQMIRDSDVVAAYEAVNAADTGKRQATFSKSPQLWPFIILQGTRWNGP